MLHLTHAVLSTVYHASLNGSDLASGNAHAAHIAHTPADIAFSTTDGLSATIDGSRQTLAVLSVRAADLPSGRFHFLPLRSFGGSHRLGDVTMRVRHVGQPSYTSLTSATATAAVVALAPQGHELAAANLTAALGPQATAYRLSLERRYETPYDETTHAAGRGFRLRFTLRNGGDVALEVGAWGLPMVLETMGTQGPQKSLDDLAATCSMVDPAIIGGHGWVSATRMTGTGPVLLVAPEDKAGVQAWSRSEASGGEFYELLSHTRAYAENEWLNSSARQWVTPTAATIPPGGNLTISYRVLAAGSVRDKESALAAAGIAVLQAVPGYTIATDMQNATLSVLPPRGASLLSVQAVPASAVALGAPLPVGSRGYLSVGVRGLQPGRVAIEIRFSDGSVTTASYFVLPPLNELLASYGKFASEVAWYANTSDPFGRAPCVLGYNRELKKQIGYHGPGGYEDHRIFNNGLSDEAGAGANVGFAAKVGGAPVQAEVSKLDAYVTQTLYGVKPGLPFGASLQCVEGQQASEAPSCGPPSSVGPTADGVMASMFWVPTNLTLEAKMPGYDYDWRWFCDQEGSAPCPDGWPGWRWDQARAASLGRAYNYPHQSSVLLAMYLASANYEGLTSVHEPRWYLMRAYKTIVAMYYQASWYAHQGLMDATNFWTILQALRDEGMHEEADVVEGIMFNRTLRGVDNQCRFYVPPGAPYPAPGDPGDRGSAYPGCHWYLAENRTVPWANQTGLPGAGSEFAWDTTGQEEAYIWGAYFASTLGSAAAAKLARSALDQILSYTPLVANWAWHGSAYGEGDFGNNGYYELGNERVLQHYRSGLNSIPTTEAFLAEPTDVYLLRLAAGSIGGVLANIDPTTGANSMGFHSDPANLFFDPASGDWGLALYGHAHNTHSFLVRHEDFGWQCYFCDVSLGAGKLTLTTRDSLRRRVYVAPLGLQIRSDAGTIERVEATLDAADEQLLSVTVVFSAVGSQPLEHFRLRLVTRAGTLSFRPIGSFVQTRGAYEIPPDHHDKPTEVKVSWRDHGQG